MSEKRNVPKLRFPEFNEPWDSKLLGEIAEVRTGPFGSVLHKDDYVEVGTPIITVEHLSDLGIVHSNLPLVSDDDKLRLKSYTLKEGDLVFSRVGSVDRCSIISPSEDGWLFSGRLLRVRLQTGQAQFFNHFFQLERSKQKVRSVAVGQTMPSINTEILKGILVEFPSPTEQQKIAEFLTAVDQRIELLQTKKEKLEAYKKGVMQKIFSQQLRFKADDGSDFPDWEERKLGDLGSVYQPKTISQSDLTEEGYDVFGANGIIGKYHSYNHEFPQVAVTCRGNTCGTINWTNPKSWITGNAMVVNTDENPSINKRFLFYILTFSDLKYLITGSGQPQITGDLKNHKLQLPSIEEQEKIVQFLTSLDTVIDNLNQQINQTQTWKKGLLQKMFV